MAQRAQCESRFFRLVNTQGCVCKGVGKSYPAHSATPPIQFLRRYGKEVVEKRSFHNAADTAPTHSFSIIRIQSPISSNFSI